MSDALAVIEPKNRPSASESITVGEPAGVHLTKTGLTFSRAIPIDEWAAFGQQLKKIEGAIQWYIGDWLNYGEKTYGEMYNEALIITGYKYDSLRQMKRVAGAVQLCRRLHNLSWSHHQEVAALEPEHQTEMLTRAQTDELSVSDLREVVKQTYQPQLVEEAERTAQEQERLERLFKIPVTVRWIGGDRKPFFTVQLKYADAKDVEKLAETFNEIGSAKLGYAVLASLENIA